MKYLAIDGDHVGAKLEKYLLDNDEDSLSKFSSRLTSFLETLAEVLEAEGFSIVYLGGDSVLAKRPNIDVKMIADSIQSDHVSFSVGIGTSCHDAYVALKYAKVSGRDCMIDYRDGTFRRCDP